MRILLLINFGKKHEAEIVELKARLDKFLDCYHCVSREDMENSLKEMENEGLLTIGEGNVILTERGVTLSREFQGLLFKREPILEIVAGLTDGSITSLIVIISAYLGGIAAHLTLFAATLTLAAVALTGFSSLVLGGKTEDIADLMSLRNLMESGLHCIPEGDERDKSMSLIATLFAVLRKEINRSNFVSATISLVATLISGIIPIAIFILLPTPYNLIISLAFVAVIVGLFLVRYRARKTGVHWRVTLIETIGIIIAAVLVSLLVGGG